MRKPTDSERRRFLQDLDGLVEAVSQPLQPTTRSAPRTRDAERLDGPVPKGPPPALDGTVHLPSDRRFVIAAEGVPSFMVSAGPRANMPLAPLRH